MRILALDIGTGTQDILLLDTRLDAENAYKLVLPSPTLILRQRIQEATRRRQPILLKGVTMGGGPCSWAVEDHLKQGLPVYATPSAARTINDDLEAVGAIGVRVIAEEEAGSLEGKAESFTLTDVDFSAVRRVFANFNVDLDSIDLLAVAVFDHGNAPPGESDRKFRFHYLEDRVRSSDRLSSFAYRSGDIPSIMTRLLAVRESLADVPVPLLVMDTAPAAVLGASLDSLAFTMKRKLVVNLGNFHTLAFRLGDEGIEGFFEHHTGELTAPALESLVRRLASGELTDEEVFASQGHGARVFNHEPMQLEDAGAPVILTGPRRSMLNQTSFPLHHAIPFGDMMIAGCFGLVAAAADHFPEYSGEIESALSRGSVATAPWDRLD